MHLRFDGRSVVVTGAGSGIGRASAIAFAGCGASVIASDINSESLAETAELINQAGGKVEAHTSDVTDASQVNALIEFTMQSQGRLDVMFNNAGGAMPAPLHTATQEIYHDIMALKLDSVFFGSMAALTVMRQQRSGCILTTTSGAGLAAEPNLAIYGAAKAAIINMMRSIAIEYGSEGIRANTISPGAMATPGLHRWLATLPGGAQAYEKQIPSARLGTAEDIARAALFLASDEAAYINGTVLPVDGGIHAKLATPRLEPR